MVAEHATQKARAYTAKNLSCPEKQGFALRRFEEGLQDAVENSLPIDMVWLHSVVKNK